MSHTYVKLDNNTISITHTPAAVTTVFTFDYLTRRKLEIEKQKEEYRIDRDLELAEVNAHLAKCTELDIVALK